MFFWRPFFAVWEAVWELKYGGWNIARLLQHLSVGMWLCQEDAWSHSKKKMETKNEHKINPTDGSASFL